MGRPRHCYIHAEPELDPDGKILQDRLVTFCVVQKDKKGLNEQKEFVFRRDQVYMFHMSHSDNRVVKFNVLSFDGEQNETKIVFETVYKKHQFAELFTYGPKAPVVANPLSVRQSSNSPRQLFSNEDGDHSILCMTWNMGDKAQTAFEDCHLLFPNV